MDANEAQRETIKLKRRAEKKSLTKRTIEALPVPATEANGKAGMAWTYDIVTPRLAVCVYSTGARTWFWVGRGPDNRSMRFKLGEYPEIAPDQARKLAAKVSAGIANGIDPRHQKWRARREMTLAELFDRYLEDHAKAHKRTWEQDQAQFNRYCGNLKSRSASTIVRPDVAELHRKIGKDHGHYAANRLLALLSKVYAFAETLGCSGTNPARGIQRFREKSRERFLSGEELQRFFQALTNESQLFQDFFALLLLTGARRGNVQAMQFDQLNLTQATWRIPETKNGQALTVHLPAEALEILGRRQTESEGNPWVFPGGKKNPDEHLKGPEAAWRRILKRAGLDDLRMHDLRRTLGSWQAATGASLPIIGKTLGHKSQATTQIYARLNLDPVRRSVDTAVSAMLAAANGSKERGADEEKA
jgi:integrase